ncbi:hypothetical protein SASPL_115339 [Salvia splendens]|uniref:Ubiquitin-like domain-containing protein n=2 Tax=Salvia splendens TaxID=180675 RepID=A0A8X9A215_SALSN|nr:hypothetical protein SASPL_115339 [Salvia splendens]
MGQVQEKWKSGPLKMKLVAEILTGNLFYVEVGENATERYSLDKDEASLKDCGVEDSSHIYIFFRPQDKIAASPSTPKDSSAPGEPSQSSGLTNGDNTDEVNEDEAPHQENASNEANEPSASVHPEE